MLKGLLWFDNDPQRSIAAKVENAARRFQEKNGIPPNTCYVNQAMLGGRELLLNFEGRELRVLPASNILANHFWIGRDESFLN